MRKCVSLKMRNMSPSVVLNLYTTYAHAITKITIFKNQMRIFFATSLISLANIQLKAIEWFCYKINSSPCSNIINLFWGHLVFIVDANNSGFPPCIANIP